MNRRAFIHHTAALAASGSAFAQAKPSAVVPLHQLSRQGCGRASGYAEANKIVTAKNRTHVAWIDSAPEGFRVRVATLNRTTGKWSPTYTVGQAKDNHGGPALTIDSDGYLHNAYFPHHDPFRYRRSKRPHDASEWEEEIQFGERLTYPTMICGADTTLYFTARRSFSDRPWFVDASRTPDREKSIQYCCGSPSA